MDEASNGVEVLEFTKKNLVDIYILDIFMPILNGLETAARLIKIDQASKIIILSIHDGRNLLEKALKTGARAYIMKESATEEVISAIREVHVGRFFLSSAISKYAVDGFLGKSEGYKEQRKAMSLTGREVEILQLIAEGFLNKEIALRLNLSLNMVHVPRKNIMHKLDIHKQADLIRYAIKEGIAKL